MKMVAYKCPNCGAELRSDIERKSVFCEFCGGEIVFDEEFQRVILHEENIKELAQEINKGLADSQYKGVDSKVLDSVLKIKDSLRKIQGLQAEISERQNEIMKLENLRKELTAPVKRIIPLGVLVLMLYILVQMICLSEIHIILRLPVFLLGIIISVISFRVITFPSKFKLEEIQENTEVLRAEIEERSSQITNINNTTDYSVIPVQYLNVDAVDHIYASLVSKRALTMQQAFLNYEEKLQRDRIEELRKEEFFLHKQHLAELKNLQAQNAHLRAETGWMMGGNKRNSKSGFGLDDAVRLGSAFAIGASVAKKIKDELL